MLIASREIGVNIEIIGLQTLKQYLPLRSRNQVSRSFEQLDRFSMTAGQVMKASFN